MEDQHSVTPHSEVITRDVSVSPRIDDGHSDGVAWSEEEEQDVQSEQDDSDLESSESHVEPAKDATELELERAIFGDAQGFRTGLQHLQDRGDNDAVSNAPQLVHGDTALTSIDDADLYFLDDTPNKLVQDRQLDDLSGVNVATSRRGPPAWHDSDDEQQTVSLLSAPRLRKLRQYDGEDHVSGTEYTQRLRRQYEALHPIPEWALWQSDRPHKRRRRSLDDSDVIMSDAVSSSDSDSISATPLTKLLRSKLAFTTHSQAASLLPLASTEGRQKQMRLPKLHPNTLSIYRHPAIQPPSPQPHAITCLSFHPTLPLLLSAGLSGNCYLHHMSPRPIPPDPSNPLLTSLRLKGIPLTTAVFSTSKVTSQHDSTQDTHVYLSSLRHRHFHDWHLDSGIVSKTTRLTASRDPAEPDARPPKSPFSILRPSPDGTSIACLPASSTSSKSKQGKSIYILSSTSTQLVAQVTPSSVSRVADAQWWHDSRGLSIITQNGEVLEYLLSTRKIVRRWHDEGGVGITVLALGGPRSQQLSGKKREIDSIGPDSIAAIGSTSGLVALYSRSHIFTQTQLKELRPSPIRVLENLTTPISHLSFAPAAADGQVLVMSSKWKKDALRLVFLGSGAVDAQGGKANVEVVRHWPTAKTPLGRISSLVWGVIPGEHTTHSDGPRGELVLVVGNEAGALRCWGVGSARG
ncbi:MAG: hypothetical protein M1828_007054 [Chrysothrix sp. TS-e1954]|nr:MAG: hypothetical protein M1828_007054 [Chrysothrix sp. TS-e1954]